MEMGGETCKNLQSGALYYSLPQSKSMDIGAGGIGGTCPSIFQKFVYKVLFSDNIAALFESEGAP